MLMDANKEETVGAYLFRLVDLSVNWVLRTMILLLLGAALERIRYSLAG
ncbi:hypothetical protein [Rubripirellula reticaptiva]|uniref:Uncharacterized protein n=1 Tax=Rubripirellula reticaptiva TaxID=2528013 RepID=A0A5C6EM81_9BACT|nr:hypothetical protein [Rubripirellula reticaptiva]TWU49454.1 hypothetical protein Poly59_40690 [Rubripirellula reticaptiva]